MRCQIEKNKEILCDEIEKLGEQKISETIAEKLSIYRGAYKALCMAEKKSGMESNDQKRYYSQAHHSQSQQSHMVYPVSHSKVDGPDQQVPFSYSMAVEWTRNIENSDGSKGPHWSMEQVRQVMDQREITCDPLQFFAVLNAIYSDYYAVAKKHGVNKMDFYADLAKAWLEDPDAVDDKASRYFEYIVKH